MSAGPGRISAWFARLRDGWNRPPTIGQSLPPPRADITPLRKSAVGPATLRERVQPVEDEKGNIELRVTGGRRKYLEPEKVRLPQDLPAPGSESAETPAAGPALALPAEILSPDSPATAPPPRLEPAPPQVEIPWYRVIPWRPLGLLLLLALLIAVVGRDRIAGYVRDRLRPPGPPVMPAHPTIDARPSRPISAESRDAFSLDGATRELALAYEGQFQTRYLAGVDAGVRELFAEALREESAGGSFFVRMAALLRRYLVQSDSPANSRLERLAPFYDRAYERSSQDPEVLLAVAEFRAEQGRPDEAVELLQRCLELDPSNRSARRALTSTLITLGRTDEAAESFAQSVADDPTSIAARQGYAGFLMECGRFEEALAEYRSLLRIDPGNVLAGGRAVSLLLNELRRPKDALDTAAGLHQHQPDSVEANYRLGVALVANARWREARLALERTLELMQSGKGAAPDPNLHNYYAAVLEQLGDTAGAERQYRRAIELGGARAAEPRNNLAFLLATERRSLGEARALIEHALKNSPPRPDFLDTYGFVFQRLEMHARAVEQFQAAILLGGQVPPDIYTHLGDSQLALGNRAAAEEAWHLALKQRPDDPAIQDRLRRLKPPKP